MRSLEAAAALEAAADGATGAPAGSPIAVAGAHPARRKATSACNSATSTRVVVSCARTLASSARKLATSSASSGVRSAAATRGTWLAWWLDSRLLFAKIRKRILASARRWRKRLSRAGERCAGPTTAGAVDMVDCLI